MVLEGLFLEEDDMSLSSREKERILRALEEDRSFRYALMGLLGFKELLERFARLEERMIGLEKLVATVAHRFGVITEHSFREAF